MAFVEAHGFLFDSVTGEAFIPRDDGSDPKATGFTFHLDSSHVDFNGKVTNFNPLQFATAQTAAKVLSFVREVLEKHFPGFEAEIEQSVAYGYTVPQLQIRVGDPERGIKTFFNAGLQAAALARVNRAWVEASLRDEIVYFLRNSPREE